MKTALVLTLLLGAAPALAEDPQPPPAQEAKTRPPLKLRLDDAAPVPPRITFTPREEAAQKTPADVLPALGGRTAPAFEQRTAPGTKGSPYPPDTNPNH